MWLEAPWVLVFRYWVFQGMIHMNWLERCHRISLEAMVAWLVYEGLLWAGLAAGAPSVALAIGIAHTINALFNGHPIAVAGHAWGKVPVNRDRGRFAGYLAGLAVRLRERRPRYIQEVLLLGGLVRGELRPTTDADVAFVSSGGWWNGILACNWLVLERARAFLSGFPLDAYCYRSRRELEQKMRVHEEIPFVLYRQNGAGEGDIGDFRERIVVTKNIPKAPRVILVGAGGGHLTEALLAVEGLRIKRTIATFCLPHTRESLQGEVLYCLVDPHGNVWKYLLNLLQSTWMVLRVRPHVVLSTGGGMSIAACLVGKFVGSKVIYVESGARVHTMSKTGKLLYRFADLFVVQWAPLAEKYPKAVVGGVLL